MKRKIPLHASISGLPPCGCAQDAATRIEPDGRAGFAHGDARAADLHAVLVRPEIPHNTGAIGRTCVALGCDLALVKPLGFALSDEYVRRAGLDYWQHLPLSVYDNWDDFLDRARPGRMHFLSTKGGRSIYDTTFEPGDTLLFGNENSGLPGPFYDRYRDALVRIPMPGPHARSLNLANAASIALYEAFRQIRGKCAAE